MSGSCSTVVYVTYCFLNGHSFLQLVLKDMLLGSDGRGGGARDCLGFRSPKSIQSSIEFSGQFSVLI